MDTSKITAGGPSGFPEDTQKVPEVQKKRNVNVFEKGTVTRAPDKQITGGHGEKAVVHSGFQCELFRYLDIP